jgi:hypothetical protein
LIQGAAALNVMPADILGVVKGDNGNGKNNENDRFSALTEPRGTAEMRGFL